MKPSDMKEIFEPIVKQVIDLVWGQIKATRRKIKAVLLVGGFGQNNYLKERLRKGLINNINQIEVIQPPHAWTAVVRGAVMKGIANHDNKLVAVHIGPRAARKHYGILLETDYDETVHSVQTRQCIPSRIVRILLIYSQVLERLLWNMGCTVYGLVHLPGNQC